MNQNFQESLILLSLTIMPETEADQRGNRKVLIAIGKNGESPTIRPGVLAELYESDLIGSLIDDYAQRCLTEPISPVSGELDEPAPADLSVFAQQPNQL